MTYQNFIRYALLKDLFLSLFFLIFIPLIYFGAQLHKEPNRGCVLATLTVGRKKQKRRRHQRTKTTK